MCVCVCQMVLTAFQQQKDVQLKSSPADLVTETDQLVEKILISAIRGRYPEHRSSSPRLAVIDQSGEKQWHRSFMQNGF